MKKFIYKLIQKILNRSPERRKNLWKVLNEEFGRSLSLGSQVRKKWPQLAFAAPGHFYSPLPNINEAVEYRNALLRNDVGSLAGIDLKSQDQIELCAALEPYVLEFDWPEKAVPERRYFWDNDQYRRGDAVCLYAMMRHFKPKRIIEVGSGYSSGLMLDCVDLGRCMDVELTFIEPYPERLNRMMGILRPVTCKVHNEFIQKVDPQIFRGLEKGDFLFIDSSHVSKAGSDLNHIVFEILPLLQRGVLVHFHDIFWPFEYPEQWIREGRAWNENYLLRAFLSYNISWKVALFGSFLAAHQVANISQAMAKNGCGGFLWIERHEA